MYRSLPSAVHEELSECPGVIINYLNKYGAMVGGIPCLAPALRCLSVN